MIRSLGGFIMWLVHIIVLNMGYLSICCILTEGHNILLIKPGGFLHIICHLESLSICLGTKYLGHLDELLRIIDESICPLLLVYVDKTISLCIGINGKPFILIGYIHSILYLFTSIPYHLSCL